MKNLQSSQAAGLINATVSMTLRAKLSWGVATMVSTHHLKELDMLTELGAIGTSALPLVLAIKVDLICNTAH